jgi:hypothetical protein
MKRRTICQWGGDARASGKAPPLPCCGECNRPEYVVLTDGPSPSRSGEMDRDQLLRDKGLSCLPSSLGSNPSPSTSESVANRTYSYSW